MLHTYELHANFTTELLNTLKSVLYLIDIRVLMLFLERRLVFSFNK